MTRTRAEEIARTLGKRHIVIFRSQRCLVVNVARALTKGTPISSLILSTDVTAPLFQGGFYVPVRSVWEEPK